MYPFYIFMAALTIFLIYNYRQIIKEKLGYNQIDNKLLEQSVQDLQSELRGTADAIIEQFAQEHHRMELNLIKAQERIAQLELLLEKASQIQEMPNSRHLDSENTTKDVEDTTKNPSDQKIRTVCDLAAFGMDIHEISKATGIPYSEVRLLINIGRKQPRCIITD